MTALLTIVAAILVFGIVVLVHEWGHFRAARRCGVRVEEFAIGFGPAVWKHTGKDDTLYSIRLLPLGGYNMMAGYIDPDVYAAEVHSFSMEKSYTIRVSRRYLEPDDRVLLVDDILASGQAILGLLEIVSRAGAEAVGVGVAIEKATKDGGEVLRRMGLRVESLVKVERIEDGHIILGED